MSLEAYTAVWKDKRRINPGQKLVLLVLADFASPKGWCYPSVGTIAEMAQMSERNTVRVLRWLSQNSFVQVMEGAGINGSNLYGIEAVCKGRFEPPGPDEIWRSFKNKSWSKAGGRRAQGGDKMSGGVTKCQTDTPKPAVSPKPLGTLDSLNTEAGSWKRRASEWPDQDDVLEFAKQYPGNLAKGIPAVIPEAWADGWWGFQTFRVQKFAPDWKAQMTWHFERDWVNGSAHARGVTLVVGRTQSVWSLKQKLEQLEKAAAEHPANEASSAYMTDCSDEERADFDRLQQQIRDTQQQIAGITPLPPAA